MGLKTTKPRMARGASRLSSCFYFMHINYFFMSANTAWAAANLAMGTRKGEQLT